ncbi:ABC transporter substrate-binding protein [Oceanimonas pelagia]
MMRKTTVLFAAGLSLLAMSSASARDWSQIRVAVEGAYPPFSSTTESGEVTGFDIDIANALCEQMQAKCELISQDWDGMIPGLLARKFDAIIASMSITEERKRKVDFTHKYYQIPAIFVGASGTDLTLSPEGLSGKTVGVQRATTHDKYISDNFGGDVDIKRYGSQDEAYLDLSAGRLDLLLVNELAVRQGFLDLDAGKGFSQVGEPVTDPRWYGEGVGIAVRKQDQTLKQKLNDAIKAIRANGRYREINDRYFPVDIFGPELP